MHNGFIWKGKEYIPVGSTILVLVDPIAGDLIQLTDLLRQTYRAVKNVGTIVAVGDLGKSNEAYQIGTVVVFRPNDGTVMNLTEKGDVHPDDPLIKSLTLSEIKCVIRPVLDSITDQKPKC